MVFRQLKHMVETDLGAGSKDEDVETRGEEKKLVVGYEYVGLSEICGDNVLSRRVRISLSQKLMVLLEPQVEKAPRADAFQLHALSAAFRLSVSLAILPLLI